MTFAPPTMERLMELASGANGILIAVNAEKIARADPRLVDIVNRNLGYPDGIGAVMALRRAGIRTPRIAGVDLWLGMIHRYGSHRSCFLIGAQPSVIETTARRLQQQNPSIRLGFRDGFGGATDFESLVQDLDAHRAEVVFVGMGSPRQELLMDRLYARHPAVYVGVGGSFDVFVGRKPRAPRWIQRGGMEWAYQLVRDPTRLRRMPAHLRFVWLLASGRT
jgi:UDP-N-acetyl-D-mannosaminouronate:lipid I N-acetyl-D-mannosaminouronosyltransferase